MDVSHHHRFSIPDRSFASQVKRDITRLAEGFTLSPTEVGKVNVIAAEMTSNLTKFSPSGGEILVRQIGKPLRGIELVCLDNGPGMSEPLRMLEDGVSTQGTAGEGLGAIKRMSDEFDIFSQPGIGTVIMSRVLRKKPRPESHLERSSFEVGCIIVPMPQEVDCGDGYAVIENGPELYLLALDGLGHGTHAHQAAQLAVDYFCNNTSKDPAQALKDIHANIRRSRGAVGLMAHLSASSQTINYCGIGNIAGKLFSSEGGNLTNYKNIISYNGILGHNIPTAVNNQRHEWGRNRILILHSDGLKSRWELNKYPQLHRHHATTIAAVLYKENSRQTDDTLVMVCKSKILG